MIHAIRQTENRSSQQTLRRLIAAMLLLSAILVGCQAGDAPDSDGDGDDSSGAVSTSEFERFDLRPMSSEVVFQARQVDLDRDPFYGRSDVADCTIYRDGRVIYFQPGSGTTADRIMLGFADQQRITDYLINLSIEGNFFDYGQNAERQLPTGARVYNQMTMDIDGESHTTDNYGGWPGGYRYYETTVDNCAGVVSDTAQEIAPTAGWVSIREATYEGNDVSLPWEVNDQNTFSIASASMEEQPMWLDSDVVLPLWQTIHDNGERVLFEDGEHYYQVAIAVPGLTLDAPPAPAR